MSKLLRKVSIILLLVCFLLSFTACSNSDTVKVTFKQTGRPTVVKEVKKGESLLDVPRTVGEYGYEIVWDRTDFTNLQEDVTVKAIKTPKQFTITYDLGSRSNDNFASIENYEQRVLFNEMVVTYKPTCSGYAFIDWQIEGKDKTFKDGKYVYAEDITLIAIWEVSDNDDDRFSPMIPSN